MVIINDQWSLTSFWIVFCLTNNSHQTSELQNIGSMVHWYMAKKFNMIFWYEKLSLFIHISIGTLHLEKEDFITILSTDELSFEISIWIFGNGAAKVWHRE